MGVKILTPRRVVKPWGREALPAPYGDGGDERIGEIIFDDPDGDAPVLLLKLLFTSEKLSIQVHPDDAAARERGHRRGKDEAWVILDADPDACIGFGLRALMGRDALRAAALDGSIEQAVDWRPAKAGDCVFSPAGTIHAIGAGLILVEVQQNLDLTYRLYDYGRPRPLQLDDAVAVAVAGPAPDFAMPQAIAAGHLRLAGGPAFQVERLDGPAGGTLTAPDGQSLWLLPLAGDVSFDGEPFSPLTALRLEGSGKFSLARGGRVILVYAGGVTRHVWQPD